MVFISWDFQDLNEKHEKYLELNVQFLIRTSEVRASLHCTPQDQWAPGVVQSQDSPSLAVGSLEPVCTHQKQVLAVPKSPSLPLKWHWGFLFAVQEFTSSD